MMEEIIKKWWFYVIALLIAFAPSITQNSISPEQISLVIKEVMQNPIAYEVDIFNPISKLILISLFVGAMIWKDKFKIPFAVLVFLLMLTVTIFQNISVQTQFGYAILTGNILIQLLVIASWIYEIKVKKNDFSKMRINWWKASLLILAFFSFWMPAKNGQMFFLFSDIILNEAGLTYCMITPVILAILIIYYPTVNKITLRITSFVGLYFGLINMVTWFIIDSKFWWMGVLHMPLLIISIVGLVLSKKIKIQTSHNS